MDGSALVIVPARDEAASIGRVLDRLPAASCGLALEPLVVDDGSVDATARIARRHGARVISHGTSRGLGAAVRSGIEQARRAGVGAAVYVDGDGEYDPGELPSLLEPVVAGSADYVLGSRFLGERHGMAGHRAATNRALSALMAALTGVPTTDAQTGFRALSARALAVARIRHDYNCAQVLTLSLWGAGIEHLEVPIRYRRRAEGRSFVRHREYLARVTPALAAEYAHARRARRRASAATRVADRR